MLNNMSYIETSQYKLIDFLNNEKIPYIKISVVRKNEKKKIDGIQKGWNNWDYKKCMEYNIRADPKCNALNINLNKSKYMVIDIDDEKNYKELLKEFGDCWKTLSSSRKLPHLWRLKNKQDNNTTKIDFKEGVDLLYHNVFESIDNTIYNNIDNIPIFSNFPKPRTNISKVINTTEHIKNLGEIKFIRKPTEEENKIIDLINIKYIDNYQDWLKIIWSLNNTFGDIEIIDNISKKSKKYCGIEKLKNYLLCDKKKLLTFGTISYYSKLSNPTKYYEIKAEYSNTNFLSGTDFDLAELYIKISGDNVIKQDEELYFFDKNFWIQDEKLNRIKADMRNNLYNFFKKKRAILQSKEYDEDKEKQIQTITKIIKSINTSSKQKSIVEQLYIICEDKQYNFDCNRRELFCFSNIGYNLDTNQFEKLNKYDFITKNCGYEWREPTNFEIDKINKFFNDIQPNQESLDCVKSILRRGMYGKQDEIFVLFNGDGGNGKGVLMELFKCVLSGKYLYEGSNSVLTEKIKKTGANQELANCDLKRTILFSEPDEGVKLNGATIKYLSGNPIINARGLYSKKTQTNIHGTIIMECNKRPAISGRADNSFFRRLIDIHFPTNFVDSKEDILDETYKLKDPTLKSDDFKENCKYALFKILCEAKQEIYIPKHIKERTQKFLLNNDEFFCFLTEYYEKTDDSNNYVKINDMYNLYKTTETYRNFTKEEKREMNRTAFIDIIQANPQTKKYYRERQQINAQRLRNILINYKCKETDTEDEDF
mgnify:CR=1 FL=1